MSVHRLNPLPEHPAQGRLLVPAVVVDVTRAELRTAGDRTPSHEGLVWWLGLQAGDDTVILACHIPPAGSGPTHVLTAEAALGSAARLARGHGLGVVAQVHSHPGTDTRHSDGDDDLVIMPFDGMFSLVIGNYGFGSMLPESGAGLHQYHQGRWYLIRQEEPALVIVPTEVGR